MIYSKYLIKDTDQFVPYEYPQIEEDLEALVVSMAKMPSAQNAEMLLSFVKDHSMRSEWVSANPQLAELICTKSLPTKNLEELFASSSKNLPFRKQLETYVTEKFGAQALS
jgi:hypothetical protein